MKGAHEKLIAAQSRCASLLSIGLEPDTARLPACFEQNTNGLEAYLDAIIDGCAGIACAFKPNLAFFESFGSPGWALLERVRERVPEDVLFIADGKRGDISTTAQRYAHAIYETLGADAATVNPLMGGDAVEPFLAYADRLTFVLCATSNPSAGDFLLVDNLHERIAHATQNWNGSERVRAGLVVGATRPELIERVRSRAPSLPFLIPGVGAQGGDARAVLRAVRAGASSPGVPVIVHASRSVLPDPGQIASMAAFVDAVRTRADRLREELNHAASDVAAPNTAGERV